MAARPAMIRRFLLGVLLFTSGLCGISYEILYGRLLANIIGDQFIVSTAVLLTFLLGIGLGALHAHRLWRGLWVIEAGIGLYAALFALNLNGIESFLYTHVATIGTGMAISLAVSVVLLLVPAFFIGVSLPLFAGYSHQLRANRDYFAQSYGIYNLGAALTVIFIEFWLIRETGIKQAVYYMGCLNVLVAISLLLFFRSVASQVPAQTAPGPSGFPRYLLVALALSSIGSAVFQLTALRLSEMLLGPYRETFAYTLCIILLGIAIGSYLVNRYRISFSMLMVLNILALGWTLGGLLWVMQQYAYYSDYVTASYWQLVALKFACMALIALGPAITFGATVPALLNTLDSKLIGGNRAAARSPGYLLYVASVANAAGFLLMSLVLHQRLDYGDLLLVIAGLSGLSLVVITLFAKAPTAAAGTKGWWWAVAASLVVILAGSRQLWNEELLYQGHRVFASRTFINMPMGKLTDSERYKGAQDVLSITRRSGVPYFFINGQISIRLDEASEKMVGSLGAVFAPDHRKALVLGVGSGATAGSVGLVFDETEAVEISGVILDHLDRLEEYNFGLRDMSNVTLTHDDAIHAVKVASGNYSLILNTVTSPLFFSSSKLYTTDFLRDVQRQLAPGGLYMTWLDSRVGERGADIMIQSVTGVFDHCGLAQISSTYLLMLCSDEPIYAHNPHAIERQPILARYFREQHNIDPAGVAYQLLHTDAVQLRNPEGAPLNRLDKPVLAFEMARTNKRGIKQLQSRIVRSLSPPDLGTAFASFDWSLDAMLRALRQTSGENDYYEVLEGDYNTFKLYTQDANRAEKRGDCEQAVKSLARAMAVEGKTLRTHLKLGRCFEIHGKHEQALAAYAAAREQYPANVQLALVVGRVLLWLEQYETALLEFQAIPEAQRSGAYHFMVAQTLENLRDDDGAEKHFALAQGKSGSVSAAAKAALAITGE